MNDKNWQSCWCGRSYSETPRYVPLADAMKRRRLVTDAVWCCVCVAVIFAGVAWLGAW